MSPLFKDNAEALELNYVTAQGISALTFPNGKVRPTVVVANDPGKLTIFSLAIVTVDVVAALHSGNPQDPSYGLGSCRPRPLPGSVCDNIMRPDLQMSASAWNEGRRARRRRKAASGPPDLHDVRGGIEGPPGSRAVLNARGGLLGGLLDV